jgi:hypothetical protein
MATLQRSFQTMANRKTQAAISTVANLKRAPVHNIIATRCSFKTRVTAQGKQKETSYLSSLPESKWGPGNSKSDCPPEDSEPYM